MPLKSGGMITLVLKKAIHESKHYIEAQLTNDYLKISCRFTHINIFKLSEITVYLCIITIEMKMGMKTTANFFENRD